MKIGIGADTGDFDKGAKKVKQEMKDLNKVSNDAFASLGNALGVDVNKIQQFSSALQGLGAKLNQTGQEGTAAFGAIAKSISPVAAGIAGLGLAAAVLAFKQLNAEADAFESTIQGGVIKAQTDAYISTFRQALRDQSGVGEQAAGFRQTVKMAAATLAGAFQSGFDFDRMAEANKLGERAKAIATELYNIDIKRKNLSVQISQIDAQIAVKREIISDTTRSAGERAKALAEAQELIRQKLALQKPLAERQRDLIIEYNGLASTKMKDYDAEIAAKISVNNLVAQEAAEQRQLLRQQKQINAELQKEQELKNKTRGENLTAISADSSILTGKVTEIPVKLKVPEVEVNNFKSLLDTKFAGMEIKVGIELDADKWNDIAQQAAEQIKSVMVNTLESLTESIGTLLGDLATGKDGWNDFANSAVQAFGDMAVAIGKIAIEAGTSVIALKAAMGSMSIPGAYAAIAAGAALVILGSAVKSGMANIAAGNYSGGGFATGGTSSSMVGDYESRDVNVNVTGTLQADGDQLVAVINNSNKKSYYTT